MIPCLALCGGMQADFTCDFLPFFDGILHACRKMGEANIEVIMELCSYVPEKVRSQARTNSRDFYTFGLA